MRSGDDRFGIHVKQLIIGDIDACTLQIFTHFHIAADAGVHETAKRILEGFFPIGDIKPYNVHVLFLVFCGKLNSRHYFHGRKTTLFQIRSMGQRLIQTLYAVMICDSHCGQIFLYGIVHQFRRRVAAIRFAGVGVQVDSFHHFPLLSIYSCGECRILGILLSEI